MKKTAPKKNSKKIVKDKEKITEAVMPSVPLDTEKKGPEVEVIADYSGTQPPSESAAVEDSAEQNTEVEEAKEVPESTPKEPKDEPAETASEEPAASVASNATTDEPKKAADADSSGEPKEAKTAEVPSVSKDAPLEVENAPEEEEEPKIEKSNKKLFVIGIILTIAVIIITAVLGFYFLKQDTKQEDVVKEEKVEASPTPIPKLSLDRSEWSLEVLNGTATPGLAKELADKLEALGYVIVKTGNADKKDYKDSQILISGKKDSEEIELLLEDIKKEINVSSSSEDLTESPVSARIIIGSDYKSEN